MSNLSKKRRGTEPFSNTVFGPINAIPPVIADSFIRTAPPRNVLSNSFHYIVTEDDIIITTEDNIRIITE